MILKKYIALGLSVLPLFGCSSLGKEIDLATARSSFETMERKIKEGETLLPKDVTIETKRVMFIPDENRTTVTSSFLVYSVSSSYLYSRNVYDSGNGTQSDISNWIYEKDGQFVVATKTEASEEHLSTPIKEGDSFATTNLLDKYKGDVERYFHGGAHWFHDIFAEIDNAQNTTEVFASLGVDYSLDFHFYTKGDGHLRGDTFSALKQDGKAKMEGSVSITFEGGYFREAKKTYKERGLVSLQTETSFLPEAKDIRYPDFVK